MRKKYIVCFIILSYLSLGYASVYLNTARIAYFNEKDYERAKKACLEGIKKGKDHFELYAILGGCEIGLGNWRDAADALKKAFTKDTSKTLDWMSGKGGGEQYYYQAFYFSARELFNEKKYDAALAHLQYAKLLSPGDVNTCILRGAILYKLGKIEKANKEYKKVIDIDPENADVYFLIGKALFEVKKFDSSLIYFDNAIKYYNLKYNQMSKIVFQNLPDINKELAQEIVNLLAAQKLNELDHLIKVNLELAEGFVAHQRDIEQFSKVSTDLARSYYFTGMAYYYMKNDSLALRNFLLSLECKPDDLDALYFTGEIFINLKKYQSATEYFEKVTQLKEDDIYAWFYLGVCYTQVKEYEKAIDVYENKVLQLDTEYIDAMANLAYVYGEIGNTEKSLEWLKKAKQLQKK